MQRNTGHSLDLTVDIGEVLTALGMLVLGILSLVSGSYRLLGPIAVLGAAYNALATLATFIRSGKKGDRRGLLHGLLTLVCAVLAFVMFHTVS